MVASESSSMGSSSAGPAPIGPGLVVPIVGPSGAGKDAIIQAVSDRLADNRRFVFPRRIVTRAPSAAEDHDTLTPDAFEAQLKRGAFALHWQAHGLNYGMPAQMDDAVRSGSSVVFNTSRRLVQAARARYLNTAVVLVDAPLQVRSARLAARDREGAIDAAARLERVVYEFNVADADLVISNTGTLDQASALLTDWLKPICN